MNNEDISKVYLLSVPLENDYEHTLYFGSIDSQVAYFSSKVVKSYTNFTYQRKDNLIYVPDHYDEIYNVNYVMYQNSKYNNKWFYAFVKNLKYENNECTILEIETDVMQTWMFDYQIKSSFVEREHVNDDTVGLHTIPEQLETGEYMRQTFNSNSSEDYFKDFHYLSSTYIVVACTLNNDMVGAIKSGIKIYNGVYSGLYYLVFKNAGDLDKFITDIQDEITEDVIYSVFMIPSRLCEIAESDWITLEGKSYSFAYFPFTEKEVEIGSCGITTPEFLDLDYVPKNKKLLTYPYTYLLINNYAGSVKEYRYEFFNNSPQFKIMGAVSPGCAIKMFPVGYNITKPSDGADNINYMEGIDGYKLPTCSWTNDSYTNWLTQNAVNIPLDFIGTIGGAAINIASGNVVGGIAGGVAGVSSQLANIYEHSLAPITAKGGVNQGDLNFAMKNTFGIYKMSIRKEYAKIIDKYFSAYGYKVNDNKIPNKNHRESFWYTKTINVNITGNIPQDDLVKIKNAYNKGITFWKNTSQIKNYNVSNGIIS